jgi:hypothetical protein
MIEELRKIVANMQKLHALFKIMAMCGKSKAQKHGVIAYPNENA